MTAHEHEHEKDGALKSLHVSISRRTEGFYIIDAKEAGALCAAAATVYSHADTWGNRIGSGR